MSIMTSIPGIVAAGGLESPYDWTSRTLNVGAGPRGVAYDGSTYWTVVSATGGGVSDIATSPDGITWTSQETNKNSMRDIDNDGTYWCAIGDGGYMITATDPTGTWTSRTSSFGATSIQGVYWDGSTYWIACGSSGKIATATDPTGTWTQRTSSFGSTGTRSAVYDGGTYYVLIGESGKLATATDPTGTWTQRTSSFGSTRIRSVTYSADLSLFCAVGNDGKIATAPDPTSTWTQRSNPFGGAEIITTVQWDDTNDLFVAVGNAGTIGISDDGIHWIADSGGSNNMWDLSYGVGAGFLVYVSDDGGGSGKTSFS